MSARRPQIVGGDRLRSIALIAVALLALGVAGHLWHHVTDTGCESTARGVAHPCSLCAGLHASALAEDSPAGTVPATSLPQPIVLPEAQDHARGLGDVGAPRGPPLA
jgi:hypothetical protein